MSRTLAARLAARGDVRVAVRLASARPVRLDRGSGRFDISAPPNVSHPHRHFGVRL